MNIIWVWFNEKMTLTLVKYKEKRLQLIKEVFKKITS